MVRLNYKIISGIGENIKAKLNEQHICERLTNVEMPEAVVHKSRNELILFVRQGAQSCASLAEWYDEIVSEKSGYKINQTQFGSKLAIYPEHDWITLKYHLENTTKKYVIGE